MDRRKFIQQSGAALLGGAAGAGATSRIRTGMYGTAHSHFGGKLKALMDNPDYEVVSIAESNAGLRAALQKNPRLSSMQWVSEDEMLADRSIQMIVVECSAWEAVPWGRRVIDAGKHLHLEKPPGNDWTAFKAMVEEARRKKLLFQTGYLWRWHEGVMAAIHAAKQGWLGEVLMVRGTMSADRDAAQRAVEAHYRGGGMFELGGHVIDRVVEVLGRPKAVKSWLRHDTSTPDSLADNNLAVFEYDRALAVITQSAQMAGAGDHRSFEVIGTAGTFQIYPEANPIRMRVHMRKPQGPYKAGWQDVPVPPQPRFVGDFKELARAIQSGEPLKHSYEHELLLQETLLRASGEI